MVSLSQGDADPVETHTPSRQRRQQGRGPPTWRYLQILGVALTVSFAPSAFGWGCSGHQAIVLIALKQLNANASAKVHQFLQGQPVTDSVRVNQGLPGQMHPFHENRQRPER
jgi:hypothetical protein